MAATAIYASRILTPHEEILDSVIVVEDGKITQMGHRDEVRIPDDSEHCAAGDKIVIPGFVDVHIHGAGGHDVMEGTDEALAGVARTLARHGTTSFLATTVTASPDDICRSVEGIARYMSVQYETDQARAEVLGVHFEGPFISSARRGVHPKEWVQLPSAELLERFLRAASGNARILTIAPELLGAVPCIEAARNAGLVVAMGHTDATYEQARAAIARGVHHAVHVYNAMRPFSHRDSGVIGAVLTTPDVTAELIADGVHVEEAAMRILLQAKGAGCVILVSDGISATGMPDGKYKLGKFEVTVSDGVCRNTEGKLAGSTLTLDRALRNVVGMGFPLSDAVRMLTSNPAKLLGLEFKKGALRVGADADIVLLDRDLQVTNVWARGMALNGSSPH
jgi:N-acetylglucosamine-6-phosphate deacetylase